MRASVALLGLGGDRVELRSCLAGKPDLLAVGRSRPNIPRFRSGELPRSVLVVGALPRL